MVETSRPLKSANIFPFSRILEAKGIRHPFEDPLDGPTPVCSRSAERFSPRGKSFSGRNLFLARWCIKWPPGLPTQSLRRPLCPTSSISSPLSLISRNHGSRAWPNSEIIAFAEEKRKNIRARASSIFAFIIVYGN